MSAKLPWYIIAVTLAFSNTTILLARSRLEIPFLEREIATNYNLKVSENAHVDEWEAISLKFSLDKYEDVEIYFPALQVLSSAISNSQTSSDFEIDAIRVTITRHTSYLRLVYAVKLSLVSVRQEGQLSPVSLYGISSFVGSRSPDFLHSGKAREAIRTAIAECLSRLQPEN